MPVTITIRNVPDETRDALAARAAAGGRSLQEYLWAELRELAEIRAHVRELNLPPVDMAAVSATSRPIGGELRPTRRRCVRHRPHPDVDGCPQ